MDIQIPSNTYIGRNVVRLHLPEFLELATSRNLLAEEEQVLAVFDCIIMETGGIRIGGLTLHDYAIVTNRSLITWARGRSKDVIDKLSWPYLTIGSVRQRNSIEGLVKLVYKAPPTNVRRRISLRAKDDASIDKASEEEAAKIEGVEVFLDYMPVEEVPICQKMLNFFIQNEPLDSFKETFSAELEASTIRLTTLPTILRPVYTQQADGVYVEVADVEEARLLRAPYYPIPSGKMGYASPYQLKREGINNTSGSGKASAYTPANPSSAAAYNLSKLDTLDWSKPLPASGYGVRPAPKPEPPRVEERPVAPQKVETTVIRNDPQETGNPLPTADNSSIYSVSRIAHGLIEGRQNLERSISDLGETATIIANLPGLFSNNTKAQQAALMKLRGIFESGYLEKNKLLGAALTPLLQPIISRFAPTAAAAAPVEKSKRINLLERKASKIQRLTPVTQETDEPSIPIVNLTEEKITVLEPNVAQPTTIPEPKRIRLGNRS